VAVDEPSVLSCTLGYGLALSNGDCVAAARYWALAASQGHAESEWQLAQLYDEGRGVVQDKAKAHAMFEIAANQDDNRNAQYLLRFGSAIHMWQMGTTKWRIATCFEP
jgi:TPR repeat protein